MPSLTFPPAFPAVNSLTLTSTQDFRNSLYANGISPQASSKKGWEGYVWKGLNQKSRKDPFGKNNLMLLQKRTT